MTHFRGYPRVLSRPAIAAALCILWSACDRGGSTVIYNHTDSAVEVYVGEMRPGHSRGIVVEPGQSTVMGRIDPDERAPISERIEARSLSGELIFCKVLTRQDLQGAELRAEIRSGELMCP